MISTRPFQIETTKDDVLDTIAQKHGHKDWELARYRLTEKHLHVLILEAMEHYAQLRITKFYNQK